MRAASDRIAGMTVGLIAGQRTLIHLASIILDSITGNWP
jgi:hypothetical protein